MVRGAAYDPKKSFVTFSPQCFEHNISGLLVHLRSDDVLMICKDIDLTDERFVRGVIQECVVPYVVTELMVTKTVVLRNKPIGALLGWRFSIRTARQDSHRQLKPFNGLRGKGSDWRRGSNRDNRLEPIVGKIIPVPKTVEMLPTFLSGLQCYLLHLETLLDRLQ